MIYTISTFKSMLKNTTYFKNIGSCYNLAKRFNSSASNQISKVTVVGCGIMGSGIAQTIAHNLYQVNLVGVEQGLLDKSKVGIEKSLKRVSNKLFKDDSNKQSEFIETTLSRINFSTDMAAAASQSQLVIEAVTENLQLKQQIFKQLSNSSTTPPDCILASNTSSLSIEHIFEPIASTANNENLAGLHFFNPVPMMALVEVVKLAKTSESTIQRLADFVVSLKKVPIHCSDTPGFIVNRLLVPFLIEAIQLLSRRDATAQDIDKGLKLGAGHPMGPLELSDYIGLDTLKFIIDGWSERFPDNQQFKCPDLLNRLVAEGKFGKKTGEGFYKY